MTPRKFPTKIAVNNWTVAYENEIDVIYHIIHIRRVNEFVFVLQTELVTDGHDPIYPISDFLPYVRLLAFDDNHEYLLHNHTTSPSSYETPTGYNFYAWQQDLIETRTRFIDMNDSDLLSLIMEANL